MFGLKKLKKWWENELSILGSQLLERDRPSKQMTTSEAQNALNCLRSNKKSSDQTD
jgi:hypothetical protein